MQISNYITELVYSAAGAMLGYILMKMDDLLNNKQYTRKEYSKFTLGCFLATLGGFLLLRVIGPVLWATDTTNNNILRPLATTTNINNNSQIGGSQIFNPSSSAIGLSGKTPSIPSSGTSFFQPANGGNSLRFAAGTPTF
jgi:hypothetical protein